MNIPPCSQTVQVIKSTAVNHWTSSSSHSCDVFVVLPLKTSIMHNRPRINSCRCESRISGHLLEQLQQTFLPQNNFLTAQHQSLWTRPVMSCSLMSFRRQSVCVCARPVSAPSPRGADVEQTGLVIFLHEGPRGQSNESSLLCKPLYLWIHMFMDATYAWSESHLNSDRSSSQPQHQLINHNEAKVETPWRQVSDINS